MSAVMAFVILVFSCMLGTFIPETMFNDIGLFEAFSKAINSLPNNMLTTTMSTELTKWVIHISHFYLLGGIMMIQNFRNAIVTDQHIKVAYESRYNTKDLSEWV